VRLHSADVIGSEARELRWSDISLVAERRRSATITRTGDCPNRGVRVFMGACPPSRAAATMARFKRPGWSTGATFTQALSCRASAIPTPPAVAMAVWIRDSSLGKRKNGTAASFEATRSGFETAWRVFLSKRIEADFKAWRDQRD
jgi:hypothetical protein